MSTKAKRDPNAPKRNLSAYLLYQNAMRETFKAQNPGMTFGQLSKYTSAMYAEMPPAEKEAWVARAEADKDRYLLELSHYRPAPGYDARGDSIDYASTSMSAPLRSRSGKGRDINAPKRSMSAYLLYQNAMRDTFKRENPAMTFGQLSKYTSQQWQNLNPEEKAVWVQRSEQDKVRYDNEIKMYVPPMGHDAHGNLMVQKVSKKRNKRIVKDPNAPKRASGAYVFFAEEMRPKLMTENPDIKFVEMGRVLGERWRALTLEEKAKYESKAAEDKMRFQLEMQQYTAAQATHQQQMQQRQEQQQQRHLQIVQHMAGNMPATGAHQFHGVQPPTNSMYMDPNAYYRQSDSNYKV